jgi:hypothetical protein
MARRFEKVLKGERSYVPFRNVFPAQRIQRRKYRLLIAVAFLLLGDRIKLNAQTLFAMSGGDQVVTVNLSTGAFSSLATICNTASQQEVDWMREAIAISRTVIAPMEATA